MAESSTQQADAGVRAFELPTVEGVIVGDGEVNTGVPTAHQIDTLHRQAEAEGYASGHASGYQEGQAQAAAELAERARILDGVIGDLSQPLARFDDELVENVAELALQIARQLVRRELRADPGEVVGVVRETLKYLPVANRSTTIRLNPEDVELVRSALSLADQDSNWRLEPDPLIARGGCIVQNDTSRIDASLESRTAAIASQLFGGERESDHDGRA